MGLKKYDEKEKTSEEELEVQKEDEKSKLEATIEENSKEEEELKNIPLDEKQKLVTDKIEQARVIYFDYTKKQKRVSNLVTIGVIVIMIICVVLIFVLQDYQWVSYLCLGLMVLAVVATFVISKLIKNKLSGKAEDYIEVLFQTIDEYLFTGENFSELSCKGKGELKDELFFDARFYKNLKGTKSRNLVSVKYKDKPLAVADLAGNILVKNRLSPMFLGKFYDYTSSYDKQDKRILMQIKGGQFSRAIDDIDDLKLMEGNDTYVIYSNDDEWRKVLNQKTIKDITQLKIDKTLIDVIISIRAGKCSIGIDYIDEFMNIPVDNSFNMNNVKRTELDLNKVLKIFDDLN